MSRVLLNGRGRTHTDNACWFGKPKKPLLTDFSNATCVHVVVLKGPSTGSSFFTEHLMDIRGATIKREMFPLQTEGNLSLYQTRLESMLSCDCRHDVERLVGFTTNPTLSVAKYLEGTHEFTTAYELMVLPSLMRSVRMVLWTRKNFVLRALSLISFAAKSEECHIHSAANLSQAAKCAAERYSVDIPALQLKMAYGACDNAIYPTIARRLAPGRVHSMTYEAFARDGLREMQSLRQFLDAPFLSDELLRNITNTTSSSAYYKRSSLNATKPIKNADEVVQALATRLAFAPQPSLLLDMLQDTTYRVFEYDTPAVFCAMPIQSSLIVHRSILCRPPPPPSWPPPSSTFKASASASATTTSVPAY